MTDSLLKIDCGLTLWDAKMRILQSSDFLTHFNNFLSEWILFNKSVFNEFGKYSIGLNKFEGLSFEVYWGILRIEVLNFWDFELRRVEGSRVGVDVDLLFWMGLSVILVMILDKNEEIPWESS